MCVFLVGFNTIYCSAWLKNLLKVGSATLCPAVCFAFTRLMEAEGAEDDDDGEGVDDNDDNDNISNVDD